LFNQNLSCKVILRIQKVAANLLDTLFPAGNAESWPVMPQEARKNFGCCQSWCYKIRNPDWIKECLSSGLHFSAKIGGFQKRIHIKNSKPDQKISDHQQSWGYEDGPSKGPGPCSAGGR
jgi:hypothetical protein